MDQEFQAPNVDSEQPPAYSENQIKPPYPVQQNQPTPPYPVQQVPAQPKPSNDIEAFLVATSTSNPKTAPRHHAALTRQTERSPYKYLYPLSAILGYLFCFFLGILAVYFAKRSNLNWARGDKAHAKSDAIKSVVFMVSSVVVGVIIIIIVVASFVFRLLVQEGAIV